MQIVIEIPEKCYNYLKNNWDTSSEEDIPINIAFKSIIDGILLPKGHGRLIDESEVVSINESDGKVWCEAPTIIEADDAESEVEDADSD